MIAIFWQEKSQNKLVLESSFQEQRSKYLFFGNLFLTDSSISIQQQYSDLYSKIFVNVKSQAGLVISLFDSF